MLEVQKKNCNQCLFTKNRIVTAKRAAHYVADCLKRDTFFVCHKAQTSDQYKGDGQLVCRGFWDKHGGQFQLGRIAARLGAVKFVQVK